MLLTVVITKAEEPAIFLACPVAGFGIPKTEAARLKLIFQIPPLLSQSQSIFL